GAVTRVSKLYRPGPCCGSTTSRAVPSGDTTVACVSWRSAKCPSSVRDWTESWTRCPSGPIWADGWNVDGIGAGSDQRTACDQNCAAADHSIQLFAQPRCASDVQATTRPRPYCQWARSGCPRSVSSAVTARSLRVVAT